ncbi:MAG TPA: hypothetical protein VNM70_13820, partial [Burkholderiales bacterium]|nr:hypothetical protein [Burkholderiales bacterium]
MKPLIVAMRRGIVWSSCEAGKHLHLRKHRSVPFIPGRIQPSSRRHVLEKQRREPQEDEKAAAV